MHTAQHFFPDFNAWIDDIPDPRFQPFVTYDKKFLIWWGILLFACKLSSRRQLDFQLDHTDNNLLGNVNRLAGTNQKTRPVHNTLNYFLGKIGSEPLQDLRTHLRFAGLTGSFAKKARHDA